MISLLLRDSWKILRNPVAVLQELDKDKTKIIDSKWIVDKEMANRSELSKELANFCTQYPIYQVKIMDDSLTSTRVETEGESWTEELEMRKQKRNHASPVLLTNRCTSQLASRTIPNSCKTATRCFRIFQKTFCKRETMRIPQCSQISTLYSLVSQPPGKNYWNPYPHISPLEFLLVSQQ